VLFDQSYSQLHANPNEPTRTWRDGGCNAEMSGRSIALSQNAECHHIFFKDPCTFHRLDLCVEIQAVCFHSIRLFVRMPVTSAFHYIQRRASGIIILT